MRLLAIASILILTLQTSAQTITTRFEQSNGTETPDYYGIIDWWKKLDAQFPQVKMLTMGPSDAGFPLNLVIVSADKDTDLASLRKKNKRIILVNNGIHPGEPDGIDASMLLVRDIVTGKHSLPNNVVLAIIPVYNIGGCLNRGPYYRVDQNGPKEFGSRGNSQNLDLNRDFIKCDSKEARSFAEIFHLCDPDVFVDNHVSDGADYQHVMTLIASQHSKLGGVMGEFMNKQFEPGLYAAMKQKGYDLIPYVNAFGDTPEGGWPEFLEGPRYSSGYASIWHCFGFIPETHMLKAYDVRVKATYALMECFIDFTSKNSDAIRKAREDQKRSVITATEFPLNWTVDRSKYDERVFKGYEAGRKPSEVSGLPRLYYDRSKPFEKTVKFYNTYVPKTMVKKPVAYIVPQGWWKVIDLLKVNKVQMRQLPRDTTIEVEVYRIEDYKASPRQFEMHHLNSDVKTSASMKEMKFRKGDYYVPMNQEANRFLIEVLEPQAEDSYFAWNYFDAILGQKEGYSSYAFEDIAAEFLKSNPEVRAKLEQRRATDSAFAKSGPAQLNFVFQNSPYYEPEHMRYPVYRVVK
ncbi:MAG TPA: M14 family metallopeptidase [Chitinophagaceae bacterium]|nr:M14 family metallopeptidase [Chitinophagaceae bacterium]